MESNKFPGIYVRHKGKKGNMPDSESSDFVPCSSECSDCGLTSESGGTHSDGEVKAHCEAGLEGSEKPKRPKRKKNKDRRPEDNPAIDPVRYKTKMCKNWQQFEKCPYGPRCLFAHGNKEMRSYTLNHSAIATAACSSSPERQFYALGHFPSFMPVPSDMADEAEDKEEGSKTSETQPRSHSPYEAATHSPYELSANFDFSESGTFDAESAGFMAQTVQFVVPVPCGSLISPMELYTDFMPCPLQCFPNYPMMCELVPDSSLIFAQDGFEAEEW